MTMADEPVEVDVDEAPDDVEPQVEAPAQEDAPAEEAEPADPYAEWGGRDNVEQAHRMYQAAQSEDGVIQLFIEAGRSLGLGLKEMEALFGSAATAPTEPAVEEEDPDRVMTYREFKERLDADVLRPLEERQQEAAQAIARSAVTQTMKQLGIEDDATMQTILRLGDQYLPAGNYDPEAVATAVRKGHADFEVLVKQNADRYLKQKAAVVAKVPRSPSGGSSSGVTFEGEPKDTAEAIRRVRAMLRAE